MFERNFAERLLRWASRGFFGFLALVSVGALLAYGPVEHTTMAMKVLGHAFVALGAFGLKVSYLARLAAMDVLKPHPEGWQREMGAPERLPMLRLESVNAPEAEKDRKSA